jgi:hypothetical protein
MGDDAFRSELHCHEDVRVIRQPGRPNAIADRIDADEIFSKTEG